LNKIKEIRKIFMLIIVGIEITNRSLIQRLPCNLLIINGIFKFDKNRVSIDYSKAPVNSISHLLSIYRRSDK